MENGTMAPTAQYSSKGASVTLLQAEQAPSEAPPRRARRCRCTAMKALELSVTVCLLATVAALTLFILERIEIFEKAEPLKSMAAFGVNNLSLLAVRNHYITLAWDEPQGYFDFYTIDVSDGNDKEDSDLQRYQARSCGNGTIIHPEQTQVTCGPFNACSSVSVTLRTFIKGQPEQTSSATTLKDIFISGKGPSEPRSLTTIAGSPHTIELAWAPPASVDGILDAYYVKVCENSTCGEQRNSTDCVDHEVPHTSLEFNSAVDTPYCILISARARCGGSVLIGPPAAHDIRTASFTLPRVANLTLLAADSHYITVAWDQPQDGFDFYWLDVTSGNTEEKTTPRKSHTGTCGNGTIIRPGQTQITCGPFVSCSTVNVTVRTYKKGPPEHLSLGTTLTNILLDGQAPSAPSGIAVSAKSPLVTRLEWDVPTKLHGIFIAYKVKVCELFATCDFNQNASDCNEYESLDAGLDINSTADTKYCVLITADAQCGHSLLTSIPAVKEFRTPIFALSDVSNLTMASITSGYVTLTWQRPSGRFDYYTVEVTGGTLSIETVAHRRHGLCANGTIIRPDQTELVCGPFDPCTKLSCTVRTHLNGPPERSSLGVTLSDIFVPAEELNPPTNITMIPESASRARLHWSAPEKSYRNIESYSVKICSTDTSCDRAEISDNCVEHVTSETSTVFGSQEDTSYCVLISAKLRCGTEDISSPQVTAEIRTPLFDLPDVTNFRLLSAVNRTITVEWKKPKVRFDYYRLYIAAGKQDYSDNEDIAGRCGNGTILHPNQTRVTCINLETCTNVSLTLQTHRNGPPEHTSHGVSLESIFIPGEEPDPPMNISIHGKSASLTRLQWEPAAKLSGRFLEYAVKICTTFNSCARQSDVSECSEVSTYDTWLDFRSSVDTAYCVFITTHSQCGEHVLHGSPAVTKIRTPLLALPEVTNLKLVSAAKQHVTIAWDQPKGRFDFYWLAITDATANKSEGPMPGSVQGYSGSCDNGTIIRAEQTKTTCGPFKACSTIAVTIHTYVKGPPELRSHGTTLNDVFIRGQEPSEPSSITVLDISPSITRVQWEAPTNVHGILDVYKVKVCDKFMTCDKKQNVSGCTEHTTLDTRLDFASTADTPYCVLITARARCGVDILTSQPATLNIRTRLFALPDVSTLRTVEVEDGYITLSWQRPQGRFDYYSIEVIEESVGSRKTDRQKLGACANGTIVHRDQTQLTCGPFEPCAKLTYTLHTHLNGPPDSTSPGVTVKDVFIPAQHIHPPRNITLTPESPSLSRLHWNHPEKVSGNIDSYYVKICSKFKTCPQAKTMSDCTERVTSVMWTTFGSTANTAYCVMVMASRQCGTNKTRSKAAIAEVRTPVFVPPDVTNLRLLTVGTDYFTATWDRPKINFDYYWIELTGAKNSRTGAATGTVGSCVNGTIIHPDQTQVTCSQLKPCNKVSFKIRTYIGGPPVRISPGAMLEGILIPDKAPPAVKNLRLGPVGADTFVLAWQRPTVCFDYYTVEAIDEDTDSHRAVVCNNGTEIDASKTSVTCDQLDACAVVKLRVTPHTRGRPEGSSATLRRVHMPGKAPAAVTKLKLKATAGNKLLFNFQARAECQDDFVIKIYDSENGTMEVPKEGCRYRRRIYNQWVGTCLGVEACGEVAVRVWAYRVGPPIRQSPAATLSTISIVTKC